MNWQYKSKIEEDFDEEKYFDNNEEDNQAATLQNKNEQDEEDPLEAYMKEIDGAKQHQSDLSIIKIKPSKATGPSNANNNQIIEQEDQNQYEQFNQHEQSGNQVQSAARPNQQEEFFDNDNNQIYNANSKNSQKDKQSEILKAFDFSQVQLDQFRKNFYEEHEQITQLTPEEVRKIQKEFEIVIAGSELPKPVISFAHLPLTPRIVKVLQKLQFEKPTAIQMQALPCVLLGRDVVGIAKTGSGKTLAFTIPMIIHVEDQRRGSKSEGPIALILAPTRQLCQQIYVEIRRFAKKSDIKVSCLLGGQNKHEQWKQLKAGVDILIASPGRLIEMIRKKATNLVRVSYLVLDQADRMLSLGFEHQIRSVCAQIRQDRQTLLFTATMKKAMQILVGDIVNCPIRIRVGTQNAANQDVSQEVVALGSTEQKLAWLHQNIEKLFVAGKILIFANQRDTCQHVGTYFANQIKMQALVLHGDKNQYQRTHIMNTFKTSQSILIATDVASRGIDVKNIKTVINFEPPKTIEHYIHRIGRAGRAGQTGNAITFLDREKDVKFAIELIQVFENSGYPVPNELQDIAVLDQRFKRKRLAAKMGVSFAKGKDATKFLNQVIKKQKQGFSRAGIGMSETNFYSKNKNRDGQQKQEGPHRKTIAEEISSTEGMSISELAKVVRQKYEQKKNEIKLGHFVKGKSQKSNQKFDKPTITWFAKKDL